MKARAWLWILVPCLGLAELGAHQYFAKRAPEAEAWRELRPKLAALRKSNEVVIVAPEWGGPLAREAFGDELMPLSQVARPDVSAFSRAIEVSMLGKRAPELSGWHVAEEHEYGKFVLRVMTNPAPARLSFDFVEAFGPDRVEVRQGTAPCRWNSHAHATAGGLFGHPTFPKRRFECMTGGSRLVGVTVIDDDQEYRPRRCIWPEPSNQGPIVLRFKDVPLGDRIHGYLGIPWVLGRDGIGAPVILEVRAAERSLGRAVQRGERAWEPFELPLRDLAGATAAVEFIVHDVPAAERLFCFYADTRWAAPPS